VIRFTYLFIMTGVALLFASMSYAQPASYNFPNAPRLGSFVGSNTQDPLANYYGNTLVCAAAETGQDLCHLWLYPDGTFINFDQNGAHTGHYSVGPVRADSKVPVCQYWDTTNMMVPENLRQAMPSQPAVGGIQTVMVCRTENYRTDCERGVDPATLSGLDLERSKWTMGERFYHGMCYPLGSQNVGDVWFEFDDPLPGQLGLDKMFLLPGHQ